MVTWDGSTHRIFINGTQTNSQSRGSPNFDFFSRGNAIGSLFDGTSYFTNGIIDEVHIYSRALSAIEIKNLYSSDSYAYDLHDLGVGARTLVDLDSDALVCSVDWRKNGTSAAVLNMSFNKNVTATTAGAVLDYSSYANNGTLGGGNATFVPTWQNAATCGNNSGGCYNFDGTNDFIDTNDASFDFIDGINPFSVEAWIHPDAVTGERIVMAKHAVGQSGWWLNIRNDTKLELASQGNWNNAGVSTTSLSPGNWYHVVGTYDGSNARLYVNGSYEAISPTTLSNVVSNYNLTIGSQTGSIFFDGIIDEPRVYNRTLSATEISNHYNAGKPNFQNFNNAETAIGDLWSSNLTCADTYGVESSASTSNSVEILGFTADVSDGGSSATTPTNVGSNVTFTGTYNAPSARLWYLAVCKTNAVTAGNDAAPTCDGGSWAISATTADATQATVAYTTLVGDAESNPWYAFACDKVASVASCSPMTQGSGNNGSPFVVNHRPSYSAYSATDATGGTIEPGDTVKFSATTADADVGDTVALYVCPSGNTFNGSACSGTEICHVAATAPGAVSCSSATLAPIPTAHGSTNVEIFVVDSHAFVGNGASTQSYSVTDVAPTITSSNQYSTTAITLAAGTSTAKSYTVVVSDNNGGSDLVSTGAVLYDSAAISLASGTCSASDANCYSGVSCTPGVPSGVNLTYTCDFTVWFNANASSSWKMHANPADGQGAVTNLTDSNAIAVGALQAISIPETAIAYGALTLGTTSSGVAIALQNVGNQVLDVLIQGSDMARTGGGATISLAQQKWHNTSSVFDYSTTGNTLVSSAAGATTKAAGCADRNVAVRAAHASGVGSDENLYWKLQMPSAQMAGTYTGTNTLAAAASTQCADGE
ncbi:LamG domain-containing protein [Candidatus Peregrinibacteria bacterium]|nr:LamG domain-containing protein [Candidatus Peregrinibacteria bacterium]